MMKNTRAALWLLAGFCLGGGLLAARPAWALDGGRYGDVAYLRPKGTPTGFVILFSRGPDWGEADRATAIRLVAQGALVIGVSRARYIARLDKATCYNLVGDADSLSKQLQRELRLAKYSAPILAGIGQGGRLAELTLAQAPSNTIAGAVSIDPTRRIGITAPRCPPDPASSPDSLLGFWESAATPAMTADDKAWLAEEAKAGRRAHLNQFAAPATDATMLATMIAPHLRQPAYRPEDVSDLPLIELPAAHPSNMLAIVLSGDGGWRDLDMTIGEQLQKWGIQVVGLDTLHYFWSKKTPAQTAADLARIIRVYSARWHVQHVALIGYSFGADVLPFAYNRLPAAQRAEVSQISLLGFAHAADFEIRITGWLGLPPSSSALPVAPEIAKVPPSLVQCFYGADEDDTACPTLVGTGAQVIRTDGGHHFGGGYTALAREILDGWHRRIGKGSS